MGMRAREGLPAPALNPGEIGPGAALAPGPGPSRASPVSHVNLAPNDRIADDARRRPHSMAKVRAAMAAGCTGSA